MKKRLFSVLLSLCMVLALFPVTAFAQEPDSLAIIVSGFEVGKTPADCKVNFVSTIPGVTFSEADIRFNDWRKYEFVGIHDMWNPIPDNEVFQANTRYEFAIELDNKGLTEVPAVTVNGKTPKDCYMATSYGIPVALLIGCELGTPAAGNEDTDITVNGTYTPGAAADEIISVDVAWDAMDFTYTGASQGTWNPVTHTYDGATEGGWSDNTPAITVTNHSNVAVNATLGFTADVTGVVGTFTEASGTENDNILNLATAVGTEVENAPTATANFGISGAAIDADKALGTITVTIAKNVIDTFEKLQAAVNNGGTVKLDGNITLEDNLNIDATSPLILDLNGHTITGTYKSVYLMSGTCTIRGGSITVTGKMPVYNYSGTGTLMIEDCTIRSERTALYNGVTDAVTTVKNSTLIRDDSNDYVVFADSGTVSLEGTVELTGTIYGNVTVVAGTYNFDPTSYVDTNTYDVTDNGDGTWTVAEK